jgi:hypothetical protein
MSSAMSAISTLELVQPPGAQVGRHRKPKTQVAKRTLGHPLRVHC